MKTQWHLKPWSLHICQKPHRQTVNQRIITQVCPKRTSKPRPLNKDHENMFRTYLNFLWMNKGIISPCIWIVIFNFSSLCLQNSYVWTKSMTPKSEMLYLKQVPMIDQNVFWLNILQGKCSFLFEVQFQAVFIIWVIHASWQWSNFDVSNNCWRRK